MVGVALTESHEQQQWNCENNTKKQQNLCEVCFKPFNLANIDMHLEAGCAAEIYNRYNITPVENLPEKKKFKPVRPKTKKEPKKANNKNKKSTRKNKSTQ